MVVKAEWRVEREWVSPFRTRVGSEGVVPICFARERGVSCSMRKAKYIG